MSAPTLTTEFHVLDRQAATEGWTRISALSITEGRLECMQRQSSRPSASASPPLDLFDHVRAVLESRNQGRTWFIREAVPLRRRTGLGSSYVALTFACRFARVLARTPVHDESRPAIVGLLERALDAWESPSRADAVYFKSLFVLARDEGFPVRESWLKNLPAADRDATRTVLRLRASEQTAAEAELRHLIRQLEDYLAHEHDFVFPPR